MNERKGEVFSIAAENAPVDGCTVSKAVAEVAGRRISHFALSAGTDISPETYDYHKLWIVIDGEGEVLAAKNAKITLDSHRRRGRGFSRKERKDRKGRCFRHACRPAGGRQDRDGHRLYGNRNRKGTQNETESGRGILAQGRSSLRGGAHRQQGHHQRAEVEVRIDEFRRRGYEGKEHTIKAGENFAFAKNGAHWVRAEKPFKMALLLTLD